MTSSSLIPLKRSLFLLTFLKLSSIFSCLPSASPSLAFLDLGPGLALGAAGSFGAFGTLGALGGLGGLGAFGILGGLGSLGSLGCAARPLFLAGATKQDQTVFLKHYTFFPNLDLACHVPFTDQDSCRSRKHQTHTLRPGFDMAHATRYGGNGVVTRHSSVRDCWFVKLTNKFKYNLKSRIAKNIWLFF